MKTQTDAGTTVDVRETDDEYEIRIDGELVYSGTEEATRGTLGFYISPITEAAKELLDELTRTGPYLVGVGDDEYYGFAIPVDEITSDNLIITIGNPASQDATRISKRCCRDGNPPISEENNGGVNDYDVSFDSSIECGDSKNFGDPLTDHEPAPECDAHVRADEISVQLTLD